MHLGYTVHPGWIKGFALRRFGCAALSKTSVRHRYHHKGRGIVVLAARRGFTLKIRGWMIGIYIERKQGELVLPAPQTELVVAG